MLQSFLQDAKQQLRNAGIDSWAIDAELLLCKVLGESREFLLRGEGELTVEQEFQFHSLIKRRLAHEPMSHLLGVREFWGREFIVTKDTLDPRPDSETLIEAVLTYYPDRQAPLNVIDLGTGTGCLLLTLLAEYPYAKGIGVDISKAAIEVAQTNAEKLQLSEQVLWFNESTTELDMRALPESFDLVITNPPYIPTAEIAKLSPEVAIYEPKSALDGGANGLDYYECFAPVISLLLNKGGIAVIEAGKGQDSDIVKLMEASGCKHLETRKDLGGIGRAVVVRR